VDADHDPLRADRAGAGAAGAGSAACCFIAASFACTLLSTTVALI